MGLMRPVANCDCNHNAEHGSATTANVYLPCSKTGIITSDDFCRCVSIQTEVRGALYIYYPGCLARKRDLYRNVT